MSNLFPSSRKRCGNCEGCLQEDCGKCFECKHKRKFGGNGTSRQACLMRKCLVIKDPKQAVKSGYVLIETRSKPTLLLQKDPDCGECDECRRKKKFGGDGTSKHACLVRKPLGRQAGRSTRAPREPRSTSLSLCLPEKDKGKDADSTSSKAKKPGPKSKANETITLPSLKPKNFAQRLMCVLQNGIRSDAIWWVGDGKAIAVHFRNLEEGDLLAEHLKVEFYLFKKSCTRWGFHKTDQYNVPQGVITYQCSLFQRDELHLVHHMRVDSDVQDVFFKRKRRDSEGNACMPKPNKTTYCDGSKMINLFHVPPQPTSIPATDPPNLPELHTNWCRPANPGNAYPLTAAQAYAARNAPPAPPRKKEPDIVATVGPPSPASNKSRSKLQQLKRGFSGGSAAAAPKEVTDEGEDSDGDEAMEELKSNDSGSATEEEISDELMEALNARNPKHGKWALNQELLFRYALKKYGKGAWDKIAAGTPNRDASQVKSHAQTVLQRSNPYGILIKNKKLLKLLRQKYLLSDDENDCEGGFEEEEEMSESEEEEEDTEHGEVEYEPEQEDSDDTTRDGEDVFYDCISDPDIEQQNNNVPLTAAARAQPESVRSWKVRNSTTPAKRSKKPTTAPRGAGSRTPKHRSNNSSRKRSSLTDFFPDPKPRPVTSSRAARRVTTNFQGSYAEIDQQQSNWRRRLSDALNGSSTNATAAILTDDNAAQAPQAKSLSHECVGVLVDGLNEYYSGVLSNAAGLNLSDAAGLKTTGEEVDEAEVRAFPDARLSAETEQAIKSTNHQCQECQFPLPPDRLHLFPLPDLVLLRKRQTDEKLCDECKRQFNAATEYNVQLREQKLVNPLSPMVFPAPIFRVGGVTEEYMSYFLSLKVRLTQSKARMKDFGRIPATGGQGKFQYLVGDKSVSEKRWQWQDCKLLQNAPLETKAIEQFAFKHVAAHLPLGSDGYRIDPGFVMTHKAIVQAPHRDYQGYENLYHEIYDSTEGKKGETELNFDKAETKFLPWVLHCPLCREGMELNYWPETRKDQPPVRIHIPFGTFLVTRVDAVHGGIFGTQGNIRLHIAYTPTVEAIAMKGEELQMGGLHDKPTAATILRHMDLGATKAGQHQRKLDLLDDIADYRDPKGIDDCERNFPIAYEEPGYAQRLLERNSAVWDSTIMDNISAEHLFIK